MKHASQLLAVVLLVGCATLDTQTKRIETACAGASVAIKALAVANHDGKLNAATVASVDKAVAVVSPVCNPGTTEPPTLDAIKRAAFEQAANELVSRAAALGN